MTEAIRSSVLDEFASFVEERTGLHFPDAKRRDLERGLLQAAAGLGYGCAEACARAFLDGPPGRERLEALAGYLTVGETYFFRNAADFKALESDILPQLLAERGGRYGPLRVWSAGCATGEEPYSVAILLDRLAGPRAGAAILATDINSAALSQARRGVYGEWSFRGVPQAIKEAYFDRTRDGKLELAPRVRDTVTFGWLNLVEDSYPSLANGTNGLDLIICRNVLIYFRPDLAAAVLRRLRNSLRDGGWLILGPIEAPLPAENRNAWDGPELAKETRFPDAAIYRKTPNAAAGAQQKDLPRAVPKPPPAARRTPRSVREPRPPELLKEGEALFAAGRYAEARRLFEAALAEAPREKGALLLMARLCANLGDIPGAAAFCSKAISADKLDPLARCLMGEILQEEGRYVEAEAAFRHAVYLDPGCALAHFALGNISLRSGKGAEARKWFRNAAELAGRRGPDEPLPGSDGLSAGRLAEIARAAIKRCRDGTHG